LVKKLGNKPFTIVGVNSDESKEDLKGVLDKEKLSWRSWWDGGRTEGGIAAKWNVQGWPTLYLLDHKGGIRYKWLGSPREDVMNEAVGKLVKEAEAAEQAPAKEESVAEGHGVLQRACQVGPGSPVNGAASLGARSGPRGGRRGPAAAAGGP